MGNGPLEDAFSIEHGDFGYCRRVVTCSNHGDRFRPLRIGFVGPVLNGHSWLINGGGDPNYLQVPK